MNHLVPDCLECRNRIRELEAELASTEEERRSLRLLWLGAQQGGRMLTARAEKAELGWGSCKRMLEDRNDSLNKAEARIADCMTLLEQWARFYNIPTDRLEKLREREGS